ncbi:DoxX family protein [Cryobacterium mannosilyticum]|uniref:DoxX family membrane protein n=1 Tax=Cryobacterium mannosilyticum TaxID=1259190 RepID=A0A4R8WFL0_9MICO|nr:DoxX family membrane protein [Cryobacterium mannosilyticum]TFC08027.1 DoxX family membrane protein [Cryobacterium mannosilyticum]
MSSVTLTDVQFVLRLLLAVVFIGAGVTHFLPSVQRTMAAMIPPRLRSTGILNPRALVVLTGLCEIAGGLGLLYRPLIVTSGVCLIVFLVAVFPANAFAARHPERFGRIAIPLVPRLLGQTLLVALIALAIVPVTSAVAAQL